MFCFLEGAVMYFAFAIWECYLFEYECYLFEYDFFAENMPNIVFAFG